MSEQKIEQAVAGMHSEYSQYLHGLHMRLVSYAATVSDRRVVLEEIERLIQIYQYRLLPHIPRKSVISLILERFSAEEDSELRLKALAILNQLINKHSTSGLNVREDIITGLIIGLTDENLDVNKEALIVLSRFLVPEVEKVASSLDSLKDALLVENQNIRYVIVQSLYERLRNSSPLIRLKTLDALSSLDGLMFNSLSPANTPVLTLARIAFYDVDAQVRSKALRLLVKLGVDFETTENMTQHCFWMSQCPPPLMSNTTFLMQVSDQEKLKEFRDAYDIERKRQLSVVLDEKADAARGGASSLSAVFSSDTYPSTLFTHLEEEAGTLDERAAASAVKGP